MKAISIILAFSLLAILLGAIPTFPLLRADSGSDNNGGSSDNSGGSNDNSNSGSSDNSGSSSQQTCPDGSQPDSSGNCPSQSSQSTGYSDGQAAAQSDWQNHAGFHPGCTHHGINPVGNEQYCGSYKEGYLAEWATLTLVQ
jgi:hypothetical protein